MKSLKVSEKVWAKLRLLKIQWEFDSINAVVEKIMDDAGVSA